MYSLNFIQFFDIIIIIYKTIVAVGKFNINNMREIR